jgi:hypothetical protein
MLTTWLQSERIAILDQKVLSLATLTIERYAIYTQWQIPSVLNYKDSLVLALHIQPHLFTICTFVLVVVLMIVMNVVDIVPFLYEDSFLTLMIRMLKIIEVLICLHYVMLLDEDVLLRDVEWQS